MDIQKFIDRTRFLYHLTSNENLEHILSERKLFSASRLVEMSQRNQYQSLLNQRRTSHARITIDNIEVLLRDQRPISEKNLSKCLTDGWTCSDFYIHLNKRIFFWPTIERLKRHYERYAFENPVIIRVSTEEMLRDNPHVKFCRLNSGATRSSSHLQGKPPERGPNTFLTANDYLFRVSSVAEVTFEGECVLNGQLEIGRYPEGDFTVS